jgi:hypothetical protein
MPIIDHIDGSSRRVYLHADTIGTTVHPIDIYKEMRVLRRTDETLRRYDLFMKASGNEPKGGGKFTERYVTLLLGTRIVPFDTSHELTINGTLITDDGQEGIAGFDRSTLSPTSIVDINYVPPQVEVIEVATGSLTTYQDTLLNEIHGQTLREIYLDPEAGINGNGFQQTPYNSLTDAIDELERLNLSSLKVTGDIVLDRNVKNITITGIGLPEVDFAGFDVKNLKIDQCRLKGIFSSPIIAIECILLNGCFLNGFYQECALAGDITCIDGSSVVLEACLSVIPGTGRPSISMNSAGTSNLSMRAYKGGLNLKDMNQSTDIATVELMPGSISIDATCIDGSVVLRGVGEHQDNSNGTVVIDELVHKLTATQLNTIAKYVWDYLVVSADTVGSMGEFVNKKVLTIKKFIGLT